MIPLLTTAVHAAPACRSDDAPTDDVAASSAVGRLISRLHTAEPQACARDIVDVFSLLELREALLEGPPRDEVERPGGASILCREVLEAQFAPTLLAPDAARSVLEDVRDLALHGTGLGTCADLDRLPDGWTAVQGPAGGPPDGVPVLTTEVDVGSCGALQVSAFDVQWKRVFDELAVGGPQARVALVGRAPGATRVRIRCLDPVVGDAPGVVRAELSRLPPLESQSLVDLKPPGGSWWVAADQVPLLPEHDDDPLDVRPEETEGPCGYSLGVLEVGHAWEYTTSGLDGSVDTSLVIQRIVDGSCKDRVRTRDDNGNGDVSSRVVLAVRTPGKPRALAVRVGEEPRDEDGFVLTATHLGTFPAPTPPDADGIAAGALDPCGTSPEDPFTTGPFAAIPPGEPVPVRLPGGTEFVYVLGERESVEVERGGVRAAPITWFYDRFESEWWLYRLPPGDRPVTIASRLEGDALRTRVLAVAHAMPWSGQYASGGHTGRATARVRVPAGTDVWTYPSDWGEKYFVSSGGPWSERLGPSVVRAPAFGGEWTLWLRSNGPLLSVQDPGTPELEAGNRVFVQGHVPVDGDDNWRDDMARYTGRVAQVRTLTEYDEPEEPNGLDLVRLDADGGTGLWRSRELMRCE
jgi:hypothetical protein